MSAFSAIRKSGGSVRPKSYRDEKYPRAGKHLEHDVRKFHSIAALRGDGLRPELQALFDRVATDPRLELFTRHDGMTQSGPDPVSEAVDVVQIRPKRVA
jgi:hypothetical protein